MTVPLSRKAHTKVTHPAHSELGIGVVKLYGTEIVTWDEEYITLDTGGWKTDMTMQRMNQASQEFNLGFSVYQKDYLWYVEYQGHTVVYGNVSNSTKHII